MAGFARIAFEGEFENQPIVNIFHFRSTEWLPLEGNPFDDVLNFTASLSALWFSDWRAVMHSGYKLNTITGVGYDDSYNIVTPSPLVTTVNDFGAGFSGATNGAATCAIVGWRCGAQHQISLVGTSKRNRGYTAFGPLNDATVDDYSHISGALFDALNTLASLIITPINVLVPLCTLTPIVVHEKWTKVLGHRVLVWRTYSDVLGYAIRRVASFRRSRLPRA